MPPRLSEKLSIALLAVAATLGLLALGTPPDGHRHVVAEVEVAHHHEHLGEHHHPELHAREHGGSHHAPAEPAHDDSEDPTDGADSDCSFASAGSVGGTKNASCAPDEVRAVVGSALASGEVVRSSDPQLTTPARAPPA